MVPIRDLVAGCAGVAGIGGGNGAVQGLGELQGGEFLARAVGSIEQVGVRQAVTLQRFSQLRDGPFLSQNALETHHRSMCL